MNYREILSGVLIITCMIGFGVLILRSTAPPTGSICECLLYQDKAVVDERTENGIRMRAVKACYRLKVVTNGVAIMGKLPVVAEEVRCE